jgi:hypothetical protein
VLIKVIEMNDLIRLAKLIKSRNAIANDITTIIGRPALIGHVGEYIASAIFEIVLEKSASHKGSDGHFMGGALAGCTVNIKCYPKQEGILDVNPVNFPDYYLVLAGPKSGAVSSRGIVRPWVIKSVFLFDASKLIDILRKRGVKIGIATSVIGQLWDNAEIYPTQRNNKLTLSNEQRSLLDLFG